MGYVSAVFKIFSSTSPFVTNYFYELDTYGPFLLFALLMVPNVFAMISYPFDLTEEQMDIPTIINY